MSKQRERRVRDPVFFAAERIARVLEPLNEKERTRVMAAVSLMVGVPSLEPRTATQIAQDRS